MPFLFFRQKTQESFPLTPMIQVLTDELMLAASVLMLAWLAVATAVLMRWRDWEFIWTFVFALIQLIAVFYYVIQTLSPNSPILPFPEVALTIRPYIVGIYLIVAFFCFAKLREKLMVRKA